MKIKKKSIINNLFINKLLIKTIIFTILVLSNISCNNDDKNTVEPIINKNTKIKGYKIIGDDNYPTTIYDFEYRNDTIVKIMNNQNYQRFSEKEIFYNDNGIDHINITET